MTTSYYSHQSKSVCVCVLCRCNVFKAASSSWMFNFNVLAGYTPNYLLKTKKILLNLARERYPRVTLQEVSDTATINYKVFFYHQKFLIAVA